MPVRALHLSFYPEGYHLSVYLLHPRRICSKKNSGYSDNQGEGLYACKSFINISENWDEFKVQVENKIKPFKTYEPVLNEINRLAQ